MYNNCILCNIKINIKKYKEILIITNNIKIKNEIDIYACNICVFIHIDNILTLCSIYSYLLIENYIYSTAILFALNKLIMNYAVQVILQA